MSGVFVTAGNTITDSSTCPSFNVIAKTLGITEKGKYAIKAT